MEIRGKVRHIGVTTSHGRRHDELSDVMVSEPLDFVQFTYNMSHREAENRLLPLALDKGLAVVINRPFDGGSIFRNVRGKALPQWATSQVEHLHQNMGALHGNMPDAAMRAEMVRYFEIQSRN
jgi:aryl-alcohol dehydrogenase-like predicted oxidoreductase